MAPAKTPSNDQQELPELVEHTPPTESTSVSEDNKSEQQTTTVAGSSAQPNKKAALTRMWRGNSAPRHLWLEKSKSEPVTSAERSDAPPKGVPANPRFPDRCPRCGGDFLGQCFACGSGTHFGF
ncbi:uncharacterized protein L3040_003350 [Drepanopeziza brunnea f. sp. 'multigermtubi']|uniref:Uncharacterized protein n=1 Tax=Marssonina brunnea f. sp. multigermtubi (strain MB_m1) TaxID=1072389 RepID=K1XIA5_MARBU|nr:uncharacterized protein MBM_09643 [Drepanopeziza brunnea f. sp. 'multigermtubi' MB_m1]EKD12144.1 hypothetical protein MBM_09643 [Drepanopeziza brunnea f. sp. 'multigermtubi' MB_m1]KAJ5047527.1 hypothetical protein L3040_003350 [Drepanopeziza brunnea f. sp. 'multigermtubi']